MFKKILYFLFICAELFLLAHLVFGVQVSLELSIQLLISLIHHAWQNLYNLWVVLSPILGFIYVANHIIRGIHAANYLTYELAKFVLEATVHTIVKLFNYTTNFLFYLGLKVMNLFGFKVKPGSYFYNKCVKALHDMVKQNKIDKVKILLEVGVKINEIADNGYGIQENALSHAVYRENIDLTSFLLEKGASFETVPGDLSQIINQIVIHYAAHPELFKKLLDKMPEDSIDNYMAWIGPANAISHYATNKLNESVFECVLALARRMRQTNKSWGDAVLIMNLLAHVKPTWCTDANYRMLLDTTTKRIFTSMDEIYLKRAEIAQTQKADKKQVPTQVAEASEQVLPSLVELPEPVKALQFRPAAANDEAEPEPVVELENNKKTSPRI